MPFFPMRPVKGRTLRSPQQIKQFYDEIRDPGVWIAQPKLNGDRACLAVVDHKVYVQNRHGSWMTRTIKNARAFLKVPDRTAFDGEIFEGNFCAFEVLAVAGRSFLPASAAEREVMAFQLTALIKQPWMFPKPTERWLMNRTANLPRYEGVVIKKVNSPYILLGSETQVSLTWFKRKWA
jgi:ATP-dependent DNA ligase